MKYLAHTSAKPDGPIISIYDVIKGIKENPKLFEKQEYYSLWYLTPMIPKLGKTIAPHFAFKQGCCINSTEGSGGESIEHAITKYIIYEQKILHLKHNYDRAGDVKGYLKFREVKVEYRFDSGSYIADIYAQIEEDTILGLKADDWVAIEIHKTHKVSKYKTEFYRSKSIPAIEFEYFDQIKFENSKEILQKQIKGWLTKTNLYFKWLHNPNYKEIYKKNSVAKQDAVLKRDLENPLLQCQIPKPTEIYQDKVVDNNNGRIMQLDSLNQKHSSLPRRRSIWNFIVSLLGLGDN